MSSNWRRDSVASRSSGGSAAPRLHASMYVPACSQRGAVGGSGGSGGSGGGAARSNLASPRLQQRRSSGTPSEPSGSPSPAPSPAPAPDPWTSKPALDSTHSRVFGRASATATPDDAPLTARQIVAQRRQHTARQNEADHEAWKEARRAFAYDPEKARAGKELVLKEGWVDEPRARTQTQVIERRKASDPKRHAPRAEEHSDAAQYTAARLFGPLPPSIFETTGSMIGEHGFGAVAVRPATFTIDERRDLPRRGSSAMLTATGRLQHGV